MSSTPQAKKDPEEAGKKDPQPEVTSSSPTQNATGGAADEQDPNYNPEEEVTEGNWTTPQVEVSEVNVLTGEEDEETFWSHRAKLYRYAKDSGEWKERGTGEAKLLKHKTTKKIRFLLRQEKTLKVVANHLVNTKDEYCKLVPNVSSEKIWVWTVQDYAEDEGKIEQFALKFGQIDQANVFKEKFEEAAALNASVIEGKS